MDLVKTLGRCLCLTFLVAIFIHPVSADEFKPGQSFKDCSNCPELVVIPAGQFMMGLSKNELDVARSENETPLSFKWESPSHEVILHKEFSIGKYEVTFDEYDACVAEQGCQYVPDDKSPFKGEEDWGRGRRPVIRVSWDDAQIYVKWLSKKTGKIYRLPSESEWEYAARSGTATARYWGDKLKLGMANCASCGSKWGDKSTAPVGQFPANKYGLFDMLGNVSEWVADCWNDSFENAPTDGSPWLEGHCPHRVLKGANLGSWGHSARSAFRVADEIGHRGFSTGFRVLREK